LVGGPPPARTTATAALTAALVAEIALAFRSRRSCRCGSGHGLRLLFATRNIFSFSHDKFSGSG